MEIIEELKGPDYHVVAVDNVIEGLDQYDIESWFDNTAARNYFRFPERHNHFLLTQYDANEQVLELGKQLDRDMRNMFDVPDNAYCSSGMHELSWHDAGVGAIPPHTDTGHFCGVTIFLNRKWKLEWGGWNMIYSEAEDRIIRVTSPKFNSGVIVMSGTGHCAAPVFENRVRRTLQYFFTYDKN